MVVNSSYEDALRCADAYHRFSAKSGVEFNPNKSTGIRIFSTAPAEMKRIKEFDFLSYRFSRKGLFLSDRAIKNVKRRCFKIIYNNLLLHPRRTKSINPKRIGPKYRDWDLVKCVNELRAYIYGGKKQSSLDGYLSGSCYLSNVPGAVSYFALVEDSATFRELDGWLADIIHRSYGMRLHLISPMLPRKPKRIAKENLISGDWDKYPHLDIETRLPSFFTAWRAARKSWLQHGLGGINSQGSGYGY